MDLDEETVKLLELAPTDWEALANGQTREVSSYTARVLDEVCQSAARMAAYMEARGNGRDHRYAVTASNRAVDAVRKTLGYTVWRESLDF